MIIPKEVIGEALQYNLSDYYNQNLKEKKSFFKRIPTEEIMRWSPDLISDPLTNVAGYQNDIAIKMFKRLLSYMGDRKSVKKPMDIVKSHLELSFKGTEDLKDEAFVQVLKQIKDHRD